MVYAEEEELLVDYVAMLQIKWNRKQDMVDKCVALAIRPFVICELEPRDNLNTPPVRNVREKKN